MARLLTISVTDMNKMKKEQLIAFITEYQKQVRETGPWHTTDQIKSSLAPVIKEATDSMQNQLRDLQNQMNDLKTKTSETANSFVEMTKDADDGFIPVGNKGKGRRKMSDVVRETVTSVFEDERHKCDVVIGRAPESDNDNAFITGICEKIAFNTKPTGTQRLSKKGNNDARGRSRLLKVTFPSSFDARSFMAAFDAKRRDNEIDLPSIRLRSGKSKEELSAFRRSAKQAHQLNEEAKNAGIHPSESYSLRDNGEIWKFTKDDQGAWKRIADWHPAPQSQSNAIASASGTASSAPSGNV
jgi:hypothetical protein